MKNIKYLLLALPSLIFPSCNKSNSVKVMTFNILHGRNYPYYKEKKVEIVDLNPIVNIIKKHNPDIINFNEIYGRHIQWGNQAEYIAKKLNYNYYFVHAADISEAHNYYGGAILSRFPIVYKNTHHIPDAPGCTESRAIGEVHIKLTNGKIIHVLESHFGLNDAECTKAVDTLEPLVKNQSSTIFMGDLNLYPDNPILQRIEEMMAKTVDTSLFTFSSLKPDRHIDYIFASSDLNFDPGEVFYDDVYSDHLPLMTTFRF